MRKKIRICVFSLGRWDSSNNQIRFVSPFNYLPKNEFELVYAPSWKAILRSPYIPDIIIFHRHTYLVKEINKIIKFARLANIVTVVDIDDLLTQVPPLHPAYISYEKIKPAMVELLKAVNIITVTNNRIKECFKKYNPCIYVLPNFLDERIWNTKNIKSKTDKNKIVIGFSGSQTHIYDFKVVTPAIKYILSKYNGKVCFKFIGYIPNKIKTMSSACFISEISSYQEYADILMNASFDFAIAPLEDNIFNQCKSKIKFLEYSICGYAGIYSAVGPYIDSIKHNETGLLIENTTDAWIYAMELLINNPKLRNNLARNAYQYVKANCLLKEKSKEWYDLYSRVIYSREKGIIKNFSLSLLSSYSYYLTYGQLRIIYYKILKLFKKPEKDKIAMP